MTAEKHTRRRAALVIVTLVTVATLFSGCLWAPELASVCKDIERQVPGASFDKQFAITLGPISLGFAKLVTALVPDAREARGYLRDVSRIEVAVYETDNMPPASSVHMPDRLKRMEAEGWETAVKVREEESVVWVMYKIEDESIKELYVVVLDDEELVMVKARGRLERLAARALSEAREAGGAGGTPGLPATGATYHWEDGVN